MARISQIRKKGGQYRNSSGNAEIINSKTKLSALICSNKTFYKHIDELEKCFWTTKNDSRNDYR